MVTKLAYLKNLGWESNNGNSNIYSGSKRQVQTGSDTGVNEKSFDGRGNYTMGVTEQIIFPEIDIDKVNRITGLDITFVTTAQTDEEAYELLKEMGMPFKNVKK